MHIYLYARVCRHKRAHMDVRVDTCVCAHTCTRTSMRVCAYTQMYTWIRASRILIYIYLCVCTCVRAQTYTDVHVDTCTCARMCTCTCMCACAYTNMHTRMYTWIRAHVHTQIHLHTTVHIHIPIHVHTYVRLQVPGTHVHVHTYVHTHVCPCVSEASSPGGPVSLVSQRLRTRDGVEKRLHIPIRLFSSLLWPDLSLGLQPVPSRVLCSGPLCWWPWEARWGRRFGRSVSAPPGPFPSHPGGQTVEAPVAGVVGDASLKGTPPCALSKASTGAGTCRLSHSPGLRDAPGEECSQQPGSGVGVVLHTRILQASRHLPTRAPGTGLPGPTSSFTAPPDGAHRALATEPKRQASRGGRCDSQCAPAWARVATWQDWQRDADPAGWPGCPVMRDTGVQEGPRCPLPITGGFRQDSVRLGSRSCGGGGRRKSD